MSKVEASYDVRVWKTDVYEGKRGRTYKVRCVVAGRRWKEPFKSRTLADSFRAELVAAAGLGGGFDVATGHPVWMASARREVSWSEFACSFVDVKWTRVAATTRRTHAEALTAVTAQLFATERGRPDAKAMRAALCRWAFNTVRPPQRCGRPA